MDHQISKKFRLSRAVPFGIGQTKPRHFRDMLKVAFKNRDNLSYAWKVLSQGVCDGCALGVSGFHDWTIEGPHLCMTRLNLLRLNTAPAFDGKIMQDVSTLARMSNAELRELGRIPFPMVREAGAAGFRKIAWQDALSRIGRYIGHQDPSKIAFFLTSRGLTNETYYVAQKAARYLGTNNIDNAARLCHAPSTGAMKAAIGVAASTCSYKDWWGTDLIVFFGSNPANDQPVAMKYLHEVKQSGKTRVVLVNPYREPGMETYWVPSSVKSALFGSNIMDYWFGVSQGGDIAFLYGVIKVLVENGWYDRNFVSLKTAGFESLARSAKEKKFDELETQCGLSRKSMEEFARLIRDADKAVFVWSMGITQHAYGGNAVQMILNLGLMKGYVGRDQCGLMPIRGHSGVQGGTEMGAYSTAFPGGKPINAENARALCEQYGFEVPDRPGLTAPEMVEAAAREKLNLLYCAGGNFLRTLPDPDYVAKAMTSVPLRVHQDIILTDQMFLEPREAVIILPARTRYEQDDGGTETTTERRVIFSPEIPRQVGESRAEWKIFRDLALSVNPKGAASFGCETGKAIRQEIARIVPFYDGIQNLEKAGDSFQYGGPHLCADGSFQTADGKAHFHPVPLPDLHKAPGIFEVSTRRGKQFNTLIYDEVDPLTGAARDAILMNPEDAAEMHLASNDEIRLLNEHGRFQGRVFLAPIVRGNLQVHWPEANGIIPSGKTDPVGGVPDYNAQVKIEVVKQ